MTAYRSGLEMASRTRLASRRTSGGLSIVFMSYVPGFSYAIRAYKVTFPILKLLPRIPNKTYTGAKTGIRDGLVAELTEVQTRYPGLAWKHVVLLESGLEISSILDESQDGILSIGPLKKMEFDTDGELLDAAQQVAYNYAIAKATGTRP